MQTKKIKTKYLECPNDPAYDGDILQYLLDEVQVEILQATKKVFSKLTERALLNVSLSLRIGSMKNALVEHNSLFRVDPSQPSVESWAKESKRAATAIIKSFRDELSPSDLKRILCFDIKVLIYYDSEWTTINSFLCKHDFSKYQSTLKPELEDKSFDVWKYICSFLVGLTAGTLL